MEMLFWFWQILKMIKCCFGFGSDQEVFEIQFLRLKEVVFVNGDAVLVLANPQND
jgi:hypothetical protein